MSVTNQIRAGRAYVEVTAETSKLQRNLKNAKAQLQDFGKACTTIGRDMLMLSGALAAPLVMAAKSFAGFDDRMRLVRAVTQATEADFQSLTRTAQRLGRETSYTAQQVADAMVALGRMGFSPQEIETSIDSVLNLARATGTELADAGDIAANSMRIFGIEASEMSLVADVLTVTANSSAQTLTELFEGLKMGGPQAKAAGESLQETAASLAVLANMGIKGSLAGTALRKSFSQFAKEKVQDRLRDVGIEAVDATGNLRKMADIMRDIGVVMTSMPTAEKLAFAESIFDIRGSLAGLSLGANSEQLDAMLVKLRDVKDVAAETAKEMDEGLGGSFRLLWSAVEGSMNALAAAMNGTLQPMTDKITAVINETTQWIEANAGLVTAFAAVVAGGAVLGAALMAIGATAKGVAAIIALVSGTLKVLSFAVKAVAGLKIAFIGCMTSWTAATVAFKTATVAGVGGIGALKATIVALMASNPVGWILAIVGALGVLTIALGGLLSKTEQCTDAMADLVKQNDAARQLDQQRMERLQQLAEKQSLTNDEMSEAKKLTEQLEGKYGALGIEINTMAKSVGELTKAQQALNQAMADAAISDIDKKISEHNENIRKATGYNEDFWTGWDGTGRKILNLGWDYWTFDGSESKASQKIQQNKNYIASQQKEIKALEERKKRIANGTPGAVSETAEPEVSESDKVKAKIQQEVARRGVSHSEAEAASEKTAKLEERFASERRTALENEILEIKKVNDEYKSLLNTMLAFEKAKSDNRQDKAKIAELERKLANADKISEERIEAAKAKASERDKSKRDAEEFDEAVRMHRKGFSDTEEDVQRRRDRQTQDREIDSVMKENKTAGIQLLQTLLEKNRAATEQAKDEFQKELQSAMADGKITREEHEKIEGKRANYNILEQDYDRLYSKLLSATDAMNQQKTNSQTVSAFYKDLFAQQLSMNSPEQETAEGVITIAELTEKILECVKSISKKPGTPVWGG